jgi:hypothetical protein
MIMPGVWQNLAIRGKKASNRGFINDVGEKQGVFSANAWAVQGACIGSEKGLLSGCRGGARLLLFAAAAWGLEEGIEPGHIVYGVGGCVLDSEAGYKLTGQGLHFVSVGFSQVVVGLLVVGHVLLNAVEEITREESDLSGGSMALNPEDDLIEKLAVSSW